ncbi:UNKNOWN [Stylonychia lemnae]|uniref:Uncharacterized protein n=1 Tax=Stylonychia lemnae TaxID=5949 RepID=A0A078A459_STYLE|nr:UNKNOWN [Stylonychia lemnae]|eukprot:CDW76313.1 UNKNOWN [Stylonychia lemnae]
MDCDSCIKFTGRQFCAKNNVAGICCTSTENRQPCSTSFSNCSSQFGTYNSVTIDKNYLNFIVCPYQASVCGTVSTPQTSSDAEYDARFKDNFIIARSTPTVISTGSGIAASQTCVYVIVKQRTKQSLALNITFIAGADIAIHRGTRLFTATKTNSYLPTAVTNYQFDSFSDSEYLYIIVKSKVAGASVQFQTFSFKDKEVVVIPGDGGTSGTTSSSSSTNWPLIIGVVVGGLGFLALLGFLIFYLIRQHKRKQEQQLVEESNGVKNIRQKKAQKKKIFDNDKNDDDEDDEEYDDEDEEGELNKKQVPVKAKSGAPVHPEGKVQKYSAGAGAQQQMDFITPQNPVQNQLPGVSGANNGFPQMSPEQMQVMMAQFQQMQQMNMMNNPMMMGGGMNPMMNPMMMNNPMMMGQMPQQMPQQKAPGMFPTISKGGAVAGLQDMPLTETGGFANFQANVVSNDMNSTSKSGKKKGKKGKGKKKKEVEQSIVLDDEED